MSANSYLLADPRVIAWRNRLRRVPLIRGAYKLWVGRHSYEERFADSLLGAIRPGDVVWDIGANVGFYSEQFLSRQAERVVCFEPAPETVKILDRKFGPDTPYSDRVRIVPAALSNGRGTARFSADGSAPTNRIAAQKAAGGTIEVPVIRGDEALIEYGLKAPQVIKIDVEGYELEVLEGLGSVLAHRTLRAVFIEVHFALLHERGRDDAPAQIMVMLNERGFKTIWLDPSHLRGAR